jgi:hypothetical protein
MSLHPVYDRQLADGRAIGELALRPLDEAGAQPMVVDVGARNGFLLLPPTYTERATLVGFEPNPVEYEKLVRGTTDAARWLAERGIVAPRFNALYSLDPDRLHLSPLVRQRIAAVAFAFGLTGYGLSLIEGAALLPKQELAALAAALAKSPARSLQGRLLEAWVAFPYWARDLVLSLRGRLRPRKSA